MRAQSDQFVALAIAGLPSARGWAAAYQFDGAVPVRCIKALLAPRSSTETLTGDLQALVGSLEGQRVILLAKASVDPPLQECGHARLFSPVVRHAIEVLDLALLAWPAQSTHTLAALCAQLGVPEPQADDPADAHALTLGRIFLATRGRLAKVPSTLLGEIVRLTAGAVWPAREVLVEILEQQGEPIPSEPLDLAGILPPRSRRRMRPHPNESPEPLDPRRIISALSPGGAVAQAHPAYEHREGQVEMAEATTRAFNDDEILLVEAGTGIGKSLAYLLPAVHWATSHRETVVISTNTKNLQEQLAKRDIPLLQQCVDVPFNAVVLKGRGNYACLRKLLALREDADQSLFASERLATAFLIRWAADTHAGDLSELSGEATEHISALRHSISQIRSDTDSCAAGGCPWRGACFVERARSAARSADLLVVNHALTLAHLEAPILPEYSRLILDEAQNLEDVGTSQFGIEIGGRILRRLVRMLVGDRRRHGFLDRLQGKLQQAESSGTEDLADMLSAAQRVADGFADVSREMGASLSALRAEVRAEGRDRADSSSVRISEAVRELSHWLDVTLAAENLAGRADEMAEVLESLAAALGEIDESTLADVEGLKRDLSGYAARWRHTAAGVSRALTEDPEGHVSWFEAARDASNWELHCVPIHIGEELCRRLWERNRTVVLTSATLTADGTFDYIRDRLGLDAVGYRTVEKCIRSPFNYPEQLLMCIPTDFPLPDDPAHSSAAGEAIASLATAAGGRTLALFTSNMSLRAACESVEDCLGEEPMAVLCQGRDGPRHAMIDRLRHEDRVVVLGTKSFWEGVDIPGEALECLVIARLPFPVPTDPVIEARSEHIRSLGLDAMNLYYIPQAIMGFKQGLGRLIRSGTDRGVVFLLDKRLLLRPYGARFLRSIPQGELLRGPLDELLGEAARWLCRERGGGS